MYYYYSDSLEGHTYLCESFARRIGANPLKFLGLKRMIDNIVFGGDDTEPRLSVTAAREFVQIING